jgi:spore cortex formation protein SpoVR/YcgB (stage V sporulation)
MTMLSKKVAELEELREQARKLVEAAGLDPWPVIFGIVDHDQLNEYSATMASPNASPTGRSA